MTHVSQNSDQQGQWLQPQPHRPWPSKRMWSYWGRCSATGTHSPWVIIQNVGPGSDANEQNSKLRRFRKRRGEPPQKTQQTFCGHLLHATPGHIKPQQRFQRRGLWDGPQWTATTEGHWTEAMSSRADTMNEDAEAEKKDGSHVENPRGARRSERGGKVPAGQRQSWAPKALTGQALLDYRAAGKGHRRSTMRRVSYAMDLCWPYYWRANHFQRSLHHIRRWSTLSEQEENSFAW